MLVSQSAAIDNVTRSGVLFAPNTGTSTQDNHLQHIKNFNWASTSLGNLESWPQDLLQLCHIALLDPSPRLLILGSERLLFYNEAYARMCGSRNPDNIGQTVLDACFDGVVESQAARVILDALATAEASGRAVIIEDFPLQLERNGFLEDVHLSWAIMPLAGSLPGFYITLTDVTESRLAETRRAALHTLNNAWNVVQQPETFWQSVSRSFSMDSSLFPFAVLYAASPQLRSDNSMNGSSAPDDTVRFQLAGAVGEPEVTLQLPEELTSDHLALFANMGEPTLRRAGESSPVLRECVVCPVHSTQARQPTAFLFLGVSPKRPYNEAYQAWINELTRNLDSAASSVLSAHEGKRKEHARAREAAKEQHVLASALAARDKEANAVNDQLQRMLRIVDMAGVGIFEYDLEGKLVYANDAWYKLALKGFSKSVMSEKNLSFLGITYQEEHEVIMSAWNQLWKGIPVTFEMRYRSADGEGVWVQAACVPIMENGAIKSASGCVTNIHDTKLREIESQQRVQAIENAKTWEKRFRKFAELAPISIFFGSETTDTLTYCNRAWFEMTGHPVVPFDQVVWENTIYEDDIETVRENWKQVITTKSSVTVQFRLKRRWIDNNGATIGPIWVTASALPEIDADGTVNGIIGTMLDISALKFAERVEQMKAQEAVEAKRQQENFIDMTSHEIRNPLGAVVHCSDAVSETLNDMTALVKRLALTSEHEAGKQLQELINSGMDSVGTIISCSAHQKRIVDDILVLSKLDSNLLQISPSAVQAVSILRDVQRMFEAEAERNDITLTTQADASLEKLGVDWAMLDPGRVQQVLINLVTNAIKFVKKRDERKVTIRMGASKERPSEVLSDIDFVVAHSLHDSIYDAAEFSGDSFYLWVSCQDTGTGMTLEEQRKIWNRFSQGSPRTYNEYGGSGLGLFISRELSELQGGEIGASSEPGIGSTFAFFVKTRHTTMPITALPITALAPESISRQHSSTPTRIGVLVVEDNVVNQRVLKKQLTKHGYDVSVADNGQEALNFLQSTQYWRGTEPSTANTVNDISVVLMDIEMPVLDGLAATRKIRELESDGSLAAHIPIIAVSANARTEQTSQALAAGMDDSISKPFRIADLVPKIDRLANWAKALMP